MTIPKQTKARMAAYKKKAMWSPPACTYCGTKFGGRDLGSHVDNEHRFTPLCCGCYYDDPRRRATRWTMP
jgi:hypothetical protein